MTVRIVLLCYPLRTEQDRSTPSADMPDVIRVRMAQRAFRRFHVQCFWYVRADLEITLAEVPMIVAGLKKNGGRAGFRIAARLCR